MCLANLQLSLSTVLLFTLLLPLLMTTLADHHHLTIYLSLIVTLPPSYAGFYSQANIIPTEKCKEALDNMAKFKKLFVK